MIAAEYAPSRSSASPRPKASSALRWAAARAVSAGLCSAPDGVRGGTINLPGGDSYTALSPGAGLAAGVVGRLSVATAGAASATITPAARQHVVATVRGLRMR